MRLRTLAALVGFAGPSRVDAVLAAAPSALPEDGAAVLDRLAPDLNLFPNTGKLPREAQIASGGGRAEGR